ncbi:MAG: metallophosphoesterase [Clostridia bacterium]|nr:metallophosphoesterase [Clostridia bacterium]
MPIRSRLIHALWALVICTLLTGFAAAEPVRLMVISDIHFLAPSCYEQSEGLFLSVMQQADGKMTHYSRELLEGLVEEVQHQQPDALIVTGDISFNGEYASHEGLAAAFAQIEETGVDVWVIPGNHDINIENTWAFIKYSYEPTPNTSPEEFAALYAPFLGTERANGANLSYVVPLREDLWLAMCDAAIYDPEPATAGYYTTGHQLWLRKVLAQAKEAGAQVITATHQSVVSHTAFLQEAMSVWRGENMAADMRTSGSSQLNLSGHLHIQHIAEDDGIYDIATGAFSVPPFTYGIIEVDDAGAISYQAQRLCEEHLPGRVVEQAKTWFEDVHNARQRNSLEELEISEEERKTLQDFTARVNHAYFTGELANPPTPWEEDPAWELVQAVQKKYPSAAYLTSQINAAENQRDARHLELPAP